MPVIANWLLKEHSFKYDHGQHHAHAGLALDAAERNEIKEHNQQDEKQPEENGFFQKLKMGLASWLEKRMPGRKMIVLVYLICAVAAAGFCFVLIGKDLLPKTNNGQLQLRIREPDGTRLEVTERTTKAVLGIIDSTVNHNIAISSAFVGLVPSNFGTSNLYIFNSGTHEAVIQVNLSEEYKVKMEDLKETLRKNIAASFPSLKISFEPIELTEKIMAQGASTPVEVRIAGKNMSGYYNVFKPCAAGVKENKLSQGCTDSAATSFSCHQYQCRQGETGIDGTFARQCFAQYYSYHFFKPLHQQEFLAG